MVCDFLGLPEFQTTIRYGRTTPGRLRDVIKNFDKVRSVLQDTAHEWMLNG